MVSGLEDMTNIGIKTKICLNLYNSYKNSHHITLGQIGKKKILPRSTVLDRKGVKQYGLQLWQQQNPREMKKQEIVEVDGNHLTIFTT